MTDFPELKADLAHMHAELAEALALATSLAGELADAVGAEPVEPWDLDVDLSARVAAAGAGQYVGGPTVVPSYVPDAAEANAAAVRTEHLAWLSGALAAAEFDRDEAQSQLASALEELAQVRRERDDYRDAYRLATDQPIGWEKP